MTQSQYDVYQAESEFPGSVEQFARTLCGGLLRKLPSITLPEDMPDELREEVKDWLFNDIAQDNSSLVGFLDQAIWEELCTSRCWIYLNHPVADEDTFEPELLAPYPIILTGESVINYRTGLSKRTGKIELTRVIMRVFVEREDPNNEFHLETVDTVFVHELDESGLYVIRVFEKTNDHGSDAQVSAGKVVQDYTDGSNEWTEVATESNLLINGERIDYLPFYPLNGRIDAQEPMLSNLIVKELSLYNKMSRRNHLLYGTASYTPVITSDDLNDEAKDSIVDSGLGSWIFLSSDANASILSAPTEALQDLDRAIDSSITEMSRLGMRILAPEANSDQSGVALEIRNAAQTSQLASLNNHISETMTMVICTLVNWRYAAEYVPSDFDFTLSADFNPAPLGADWLRLINEMYAEGTIPRSELISVLKQNDVLSADYDDADGVLEIEEDVNILNPTEQFNQDLQMQDAAIASAEKIAGAKPDPQKPG
jgi:hypothetical protein